MGGGPSTPELAAAVSSAGGLGFLAAGYKSPEVVVRELREVRALMPDSTPFGVNVFAPPGHGSGVGAVDAFGQSLEAEAERFGVELGTPRWDDDSYAAKLEVLCDERVPVVSFTFGCPSADEVERLHEAGIACWVTATTVREVEVAITAGADAVIAQGFEAGGHRGGFDDGAPGDIGLLALLQLVLETTTLPVIATGGIMTGRAVAGVLAAGAAAAQLGTAFMLCPEAGTVQAHRDALEDAEAITALTRAFTGRSARGIVNRFLREHSDGAPSAYPEVHHLTGPVRAAARAGGDRDGFHLWAGQAHALARAVPAGQLVVELAEEARARLP